MIRLSEHEKQAPLPGLSDVVILQFGTEACAPCAAIRQRIDEWLVGHAEVDARYVPLEEFPELASEHGVFCAPTVLVFVRGKLSVRESGYFSLDEILLRAERYLGLIG